MYENTIAACLQVQQLLSLMEGCTLGELESLGAILAQLTGSTADKSMAGAKTAKAAAKEAEVLLNVRATLPLLLKKASGCYITICQERQQAHHQQQQQQTAGDMDVDMGPTQVPNQYLPGSQEAAAAPPAAPTDKAGNAAGAGGAGQEALAELRHCFTLLSLMARVRPEEVMAHARVIAEIGFSLKVQVRGACRMSCWCVLLPLGWSVVVSWQVHDRVVVFQASWHV